MENGYQSSPIGDKNNHQNLSARSVDDLELHCPPLMSKSASFSPLQIPFPPLNPGRRSASAIFRRYSDLSGGSMVPLRYEYTDQDWKTRIGIPQWAIIIIYLLITLIICNITVCITLGIVTELPE